MISAETRLKISASMKRFHAARRAQRANIGAISAAQAKADRQTFLDAVADYRKAGIVIEVAQEQP